MRFIEKTASQIAQQLGGRVEGDGQVAIRRVWGLEEAQPGDLSFLSNPRYGQLLATTRASAVIVGPKAPAAPHTTLLRVEQPYLAFAKALTFLAQPPSRPPAGVQPGAHVHPAAQVDPLATVMAGAYVGQEAVIGAGTVIYPSAVVLERVRIGRDCVLYPGVVVREDCRVGDRVILQANAIIGSDGYGFAPDGPGYYKIPQVGHVQIEDDVELGSATCVDRATLDSTVIGRGTKMDNLVQIGHGCKIGPNCLVVAQCGIAGSTRLEEHVNIGGRSGLLPHLTIGANTTVFSGSHVTKSFPQQGMVVSGNPARPHKEALKAEAHLARMDKLVERVARLEAELAALKEGREN